MSGVDVYQRRLWDPCVVSGTIAEALTQGVDVFGLAFHQKLIASAFCVLLLFNVDNGPVKTHCFDDIRTVGGL